MNHETIVYNFEKGRTKKRFINLIKGIGFVMALIGMFYVATAVATMYL